MSDDVPDSRVLRRNHLGTVRSMTSNAWQQADSVALAAELWRSYRELLGVPLVVAPAPSTESYQVADPHAIELRALADAVYFYDLPVLCHDGASDPRFTYVNVAAQTLFERPWPGFVGLPSRLSAEPEARAGRAEMLARAARQGFIDDYQGVRISSSGRRFRISQTVIWAVTGDTGEAIGQAALIRRWRFF